VTLNYLTRHQYKLLHRPHLLWSLALFLSSGSYALECPRIPEQARSDVEIEVKAAVGKISAAKGTELETRTRNITRDLLSKLPKADKVYLEQMMYSTYCSTLRDDAALTESQKSSRIKIYNLELRRTLQAAGEKPKTERQATSARAAARAELAGISLPYTAEAMVESAKNGDIVAVELFLAAGMNLNAKNAKGDTALMLAAKGGHADVINVLLKAKANVNEKNQDGETALSLAAEKDRRDILGLLLNHGADRDTINSAFRDAVQFGQAEAVSLLLSQGVDKVIVNRALSYAAGSPYLSAVSQLTIVSEAKLNDVIVFLLKQGADVNAVNVEAKGWTALMSAATEGRALIAQTLLDAGADVNAKCTCPNFSNGGWTALMMAARVASSKPIVDMLLARGASLDLVNNDGETALILVSGVWGDTAIMRVLLKAGADPNTQVVGGSTVLMLTAGSGYTEKVEALLDAGADLHAKNAAGRTALMLAVREEKIPVVQALLSRGAKVNDKDAAGKTVLNYAEDLEGQKRMEMIETLKQAGAT